MPSDDEVAGYIEGLLYEGVPVGVVARVFQMPTEAVKQYRDSLRIAKYGTDDMQDYLTQLEWNAIDIVSRQLAGERVGADQHKAAIAVIGKTVAVNARRTPEKQAEKRDELLDRLREMSRDDGREVRDDDTSDFEEFVVGGSG